MTGGANDRAAQSNLNTALTTAKSAETQNGQSYNTTGGGTTTIDYAALQSNEPSISFTNAAVAAAGPVSVWVDALGNGVVLASVLEEHPDLLVRGGQHRQHHYGWPQTAAYATAASPGGTGTAPT